MVSVQTIVENYINGNKLDAMMQIKGYGELKFFQDLREWLIDECYEEGAKFETFASITITYFTHKN